jgi:hypothetical protein
MLGTLFGCIAFVTGVVGFDLSLNGLRYPPRVLRLLFVVTDRVIRTEADTIRTDVSCLPCVSPIEHCVCACVRDSPSSFNYIRM